ncbi:GNAT family N-acetyltransferase [Curtobacterium sp. ISL-83]|uniref:GNAT family N-acetyltransferase n=1 Tax=Curtobacterium sp. ISL-83 TaxID=2819145 RepID=UPI0027E13BF9|nr:GNAT family N-acetyltransferase [Curtobacterium sp. ISL-83]
MGSFDAENAEEELRSCIWRVNVSATVQGRGVGRFAVHGLAQEARSRGFERLTVVYEPGGDDSPEAFFYRPRVPDSARDTVRRPLRHPHPLIFTASRADAGAGIGSTTTSAREWPRPYGSSCRRPGRRRKPPSHRSSTAFVGCLEKVRGNRPFLDRGSRPARPLGREVGFEEPRLSAGDFGRL